MLKDTEKVVHLVVMLGYLKVVHLVVKLAWKMAVYLAVLRDTT